MALTFTDDEKKTITRRQVNIAIENAGLATTSANFVSDSAKLLSVDNANTKFYDYYSNQATQYENEATQIDGKVPATYAPSDITAAAQTPGNVLFFPVSMVSPTGYPDDIPCISDAGFTNNTVRGRFYPTSTNAQYEENILSNVTDPANGLTQCISFLLHGVTGASSASTTTQNPSPDIPGGPVTSVVVKVNSSNNFTPGDYVFISKSGNSGLYVVNAAGGNNLTLSSIIPSAGGFTGAGALINNTVNFTDLERMTLTSATYQELLTNLTNKIASLMTSWQTSLNAQITCLSANDDERTTQQTQIQTAITNAQAALAVISTWQALPSTGLGARYTATGLAPVSSEITSRSSYLATRITQIEAALGTSGTQALSQSGNTFTATDLTNRYYLRYKWLNVRINRATGSLRRYYASLQSAQFINQMAASNTSVLNDYNQYFLTKQIIFVDPTNIVQVKDYANLSIGDQVHIVSDKQGIISRVVKGLLGTNQVQLDSPIPNTYQVIDLARMYKELT